MSDLCSKQVVATFWSRRCMAWFVVAVIFSGGFSNAVVAQTVDLEAAQKQFVKSCGTCHSAEKGAKHRQGPNLFGILGTKAGDIPDFKFSAGLKASGLIYDEATLDRWIENPKKLVPTTTMSFKQKDIDKRKLVIEYLKTLTDKPAQ